MSLRLEMLQVARLAPRRLGDASELVTGFFQSQRNPDGGFRDRAGRSDLYYTVFGLEGLIALQADPEAARAAAYLRGFGDGASLDFTHLACLARCWANVDKHLVEAPRAAILAQVERHRVVGGIYDQFLALGVYQDLRADPPDANDIARRIEEARTPDGGYAGFPGLDTGLTTNTAAAVLGLRALGEPVDPALAMWLLDHCHPRGGFLAARQAPMPDLLSTATALHALAALGARLDPVAEPCLDFLDSLWSNRGAFFGNWADDQQDCEYTYYALLALGHLAP